VTLLQVSSLKKEGSHSTRTAGEVIVCPCVSFAFSGKTSRIQREPARKARGPSPASASCPKRASKGQKKRTQRDPTRAAQGSSPPYRVLTNKKIQGEKKLFLEKISARSGGSSPVSASEPFPAALGGSSQGRCFVRHVPAATPCSRPLSCPAPGGPWSAAEAPSPPEEGWRLTEVNVFAEFSLETEGNTVEQANELAQVDIEPAPW
jgi:hypothetical protein